jgi:hypothetical protein
VKDQKYKEQVEAQGYAFVPAVVDVFGAWDIQGRTLLNKIADESATRSTISRSDARNFLFQRVSVALMRGNISALLAARDPDEPCLLSDPLGRKPPPPLFTDSLSSRSATTVVCSDADFYSTADVRFVFY